MMSFEDIQRVTRTEEDTREKRAQAQAQARQIVADAQKAGAAAVEAAKRQARDQVSQWLDEAEALGADGIVGIRYASASIMQGAAEITAYGTAVRILDGEGER